MVIFFWIPIFFLRARYRKMPLMEGIHSGAILQPRGGRFCNHEESKIGLFFSGCVLHHEPPASGRGWRTGVAGYGERVSLYLFQKLRLNRTRTVKNSRRPTSIRVARKILAKLKETGWLEEIERWITGNEDTLERCCPKSNPKLKLKCQWTKFIWK